MKNVVTLFALIVFFACPALALSDVAPMIYNRVTLHLVPKPEAKTVTLPSPLPDPKPIPMPWTNDEKSKLHTKTDSKTAAELKVEKIAPPADDTPPPAPPRTPIDFTVEVKLQDFLDQTDFISHTSFGEHEGLLISVDPVGPASITHTRMLSTSDVVFVNEDGVITRIAPNLDLGNLSEAIPSGGNVRGVLYLKAGSVEQDRIVPGDRFEHSMFKTHPVILQ